jgi:hypothetical protein
LLSHYSFPSKYFTVFLSNLFNVEMASLVLGFFVLLLSILFDSRNRKHCIGGRRSRKSVNSFILTPAVPSILHFHSSTNLFRIVQKSPDKKIQSSANLSSPWTLDARRILSHLHFWQIGYKFWLILTELQKTPYLLLQFYYK